MCSFVVTTGSAVNKGKAGPLGRRFRVEVTTCDPEDESDEAISAFLCYSPDDAEVTDLIAVVVLLICVNVLVCLSLFVRCGAVCLTGLKCQTSTKRKSRPQDRS